MDRRNLLGVLGMGALRSDWRGFDRGPRTTSPSPRQAARRLPQGMRGVRHDLQRNVPPLLREGQGRSRRPPPDRRHHDRLPGILRPGVGAHGPREPLDLGRLLGLRRRLQGVRGSVFPARRSPDEGVRRGVQEVRSSLPRDGQAPRSIPKANRQGQVESQRKVSAAAGSACGPPIASASGQRPT